MLSRILIFVHPGSRISGNSKTATKQRGEKICCTFFCSHKYHKIKNYFIFELAKKKIWPNVQSFTVSQKLSLSFQKYRCGIRDQGSGKNLFATIPQHWLGLAWADHSCLQIGRLAGETLLKSLLLSCTNFSFPDWWEKLDNILCVQGCT
jgi:hypothetical protein